MRVRSARLHAAKSPLPSRKWATAKQRQGHRSGGRGGGNPRTHFHLLYLYDSRPPPHPGPSRLDDLPHAGDGVLTKQSAGNGPKSAAVISRPRHSPHPPSWQHPSPSPCLHPEGRRSSRPIQKCPVITGLSVVIFINKRARDDPAGMLMSPQLELISCRRRRTFPPRSSAVLLSAAQSSGAVL